MSGSIRNLLVALGVAVCSVANAAPSTPAARLRAEAEERARTEVSDLLRTLCPEQCVFVSAEARVEEETVGGGAPGFESLTGEARLPVLRSVSAHVVLDSRLPGPFRTRLKDLVAQRLKTVGPQPQVNIESVAFPPRNAPHLEAQPPTPPAPMPEPPALPATPGAPESAAGQLGARLLEEAPLLAVVLLLAVTLLTLGALLLMATRRPPPSLEYAPVEAFPAEPAAPAAPPAGYPAARARRLERTLREERAVRNAVVREAVGRGELRQLALWTREMGDFLLEDMRGDAELAAAAPGLATELGRAGSADVGERAAALFDLEGRMLASRLAQASDSVDAAFAFLEGVRPGRFAAVCRELPGSAREVALRFAPAPLRAAALQVLEPSQRTELALGLARQPELSTRHALAVADELRTRLSDSTGGENQLERVVGEVLDTLPLEEQDRLVEQLRRDGAGRLASSLVTESTLAEAPVEVLSAALLRLPPARLLSYLNGSQPTLREQLLAACPTSLQRELREELGMRGTERQEEFISARREVLASVKEEMLRQGLELSGARAQAGRAN